MKKFAFLAFGLALAACGNSTGIEVPGTAPAVTPQKCDFGVDAQTMKCVVPEDPNKAGQGRTN